MQYAAEEWADEPSSTRESVQYAAQKWADEHFELFYASLHVLKDCRYPYYFYHHQQSLIPSSAFHSIFHYLTWKKQENP